MIWPMWSLWTYDDYMESVGVRDLKASLSRYLRRVKGGETIVVTERGVPIARIVPAAVPDHLRALMADGRLSWSGERLVAPRRAVKPKPGPTISEMISEDRR